MADQKTRRRLPRQEREQLIVREAVRFFAEVGLEGQTRALAQRLGVTQPLLYRYFPDKEALIERVYDETFIHSWNPAWNTVLTDRSRPLLDRLIEFYREFGKSNFTFERTRLFLFAGLKGQGTAERYLSFVRENLFRPLAHEIRAEAGIPGDEVSEYEIETVAGLHGAIGYLIIRQWGLGAQVPADRDTIVASLIRTFLDGAPAAFRTMPDRQVAE